MGLIKAAVGAIGSTLGDQWKEALRCDDMGNDILMKKVTTKNGVISNGSTVIVGPGQCAIIYDNGRIVDVTAEQGIYTYENSSTPSIFAGQFGETFKEIWQRFTYNGASAKEQSVLFFNIKEIIGNNFGTRNPVSYEDWSHPMMNARINNYMPMRVNVKCYGTYTVQMIDPLAFLNAIGGVCDIYRKEDLMGQIHSEILEAFNNVMNSLGSEKRVGVLSLPSQTDEIKAILRESIFDEPVRRRGIKLVSFVIDSFTLDSESKEKIDQYEMGGDVYQQQGVLTDAYAEAMKNAASNEGGAVNGFMGIGMMNMMNGGMNMGAAGMNMGNNGVNMGNAFNAPQMQPNPDLLNQNTGTSNGNLGVKCSNCGAEVNGKFCANCGTPAPENKKRFCSNCGAEVSGKFCANCGTKAE